MLHPLTVWCASCCVIDQYMYLILDLVIVSKADDVDAAMIYVSTNFETCLSNPVTAQTHLRLLTLD